MDRLGAGGGATAPAGGLVARPGRMTEVEEGGALVVSWRWFTPIAFFLLFFAIAWNSFLVFWYGMAIFQDEAPWIMLVFPIPHVAVGVGLGWFVLALFLNRTVVRCGAGELSVAHGPLWWPGGVSLESARVRQLYVVEQVRSNRRRSGGHSLSYSFDLVALVDDVATPLVKGLDGLDEARWLERTLERRLGVTDQPVEGEAPR